MTRICASLDKYTGREDLSGADMVEIRTDIFDKVPNVPDKEMLVTFRGDADMSMLPKGFEGLIDIGMGERPSSDLKVISSYHDYKKTPSFNEMSDVLNGMTGDIIKGAFSVRDFNDLHDIMAVSKLLERPHVLIGMNDMGTLTRVRSAMLGNEFTFGYVGEPTAPGQLSVKEMARLGDDCMVLGLIGNPLSSSKSPEMHSAAMRNTGINGIYLKFETRGINAAGAVIREYGVRGVNVTIPYKTSIMCQMDRIDATAEKVGAVNTVVNDDGRLTGYNTDVIGIEIAMGRAGFNPDGKRAVVMGSGGSAKACVHVLMENGCNVIVTGRNDEGSRGLSNETGCEWRPKDSVSLRMTDLIINCTPVGMYEDGGYPLNLDSLDSSHTVFDMVYGKETQMIAMAHSVGAGIVSGEDMLAGQGSASFGLWTGHTDQFEVMRRALQ